MNELALALALLASACATNAHGDRVGLRRAESAEHQLRALRGARDA